MSNSEKTSFDLSMQQNSIRDAMLHQVASDEVRAVISSGELTYTSTFHVSLKPGTSSEEILDVLMEAAEPAKIIESAQVRLIITQDAIVDYSVYSSGSIREVALSVLSKREKAKEVKEKITEALAPLAAAKSKGIKTQVNWFYWSDNYADSRQFTEMIEETIHPEAYPSVPRLNDFLDSYFDSDSPLLLLLGPAGTGKSRLIRHLIMQFAKRTEKEPKIAYTSDEKVLKNSDGFFIDFRAGEYDFLVLEDMDNFLAPRDEGNEVMHKFLATSDGFLSNRNRKIVMTTNLSMNKIDPALLRPGRCFARLDLGPISSADAQKLALAITSGECKEEFAGAKQYTIAEVYHATKNDNTQGLHGQEQMGFSK